MGLADTLLGDLSDFESDVETADFDVLPDNDVSDVTNDLNAVPKKKHQIQELLTETNLSEIHNVRDYCPIITKLDKLDDKLSLIDHENNKNSTDEQYLLSETNHMITETYKYLNTLMAFVKLGYNSVWADLSNIIKNPIHYILMISTIKFDLNSFKDHQAKAEFDFLPKDQILSLTISLNFTLKTGNHTLPDEHTQKLVLEACDILLHVNNIQQKFRSFITKKAQHIAPNMTALVGPSVTAQLIASVGFETLCSTPACNLPSVGKSGSNSQGYIYQCDIVKDISDDFKKQAVRQVCSKVVMCARVDFANNKSKTVDMENLIGNTWKKQIKERLDKQMLPPENISIKPLPIPINKKSKKRGGKRFQKMRDRMKMSEVEKAQNKMAFGDKEESRMDAFGEEIGLGMLGKDTVRGIDTVRSTHVSKGTKEKLDTFTRKRRNSDVEESSSKLAKLI